MAWLLWKLCILWFSGRSLLSGVSFEGLCVVGDSRKDLYLGMSFLEGLCPDVSSLEGLCLGGGGGGGYG